MCEEIAIDVTGHLVPDAGHWAAEENPDYFCRMFIEFDTSARTREPSRRTIDTPKALLRCAEGDACSEASSRPYGTLRAAHASSDRRAQDLPLPHWVLPYLPAGWPRLLAPAQARTLLGLPFLVTVWSAHDIVAEDPRVMRPALTRLHGQKSRLRR